jgi:hypothetical protein
VKVGNNVKSFVLEFLPMVYFVDEVRAMFSLPFLELLLPSLRIDKENQEKDEYTSGKGKYNSQWTI